MMDAKEADRIIERWLTGCKTPRVVGYSCDEKGQPVAAIYHYNFSRAYDQLHGAEGRLTSEQRKAYIVALCVALLAGDSGPQDGCLVAYWRFRHAPAAGPPPPPPTPLAPPQSPLTPPPTPPTRAHPAPPPLLTTPRPPPPTTSPTHPL